MYIISEYHPCPAQQRHEYASCIMSDHYVQVKVQLEDMKSFDEDEEKEGVNIEKQVSVSSRASVSTDPSSITVAGRDASDTSDHSRKNRSKLGKGDKNSCGNSDPSLYGSVVSAHVEKNLNRLERTLNFKGAGKILRGKSETNGNYVTIKPSKNIQEAGHDDALKLSKKRRPVTVDTAKAKTSLEALKLSIKQLKWKEVCDMKLSLLQVLLL